VQPPRKTLPWIRELISERADFERESEHARSTVADISRDGFMEKPQFRALIAEWRGLPAGFALFFSCYSSWQVPAGTLRTSLSVQLTATRSRHGTSLSRCPHR
jgi:hypothetical protein